MKPYYIHLCRSQAIVLNVGKRLICLWLHFFFCILCTYPELQMPLVHSFLFKAGCSLKGLFSFLISLPSLWESLAMGSRVMILEWHEGWERLPIGPAHFHHQLQDGCKISKTKVPRLKGKCYFGGERRNHYYELTPPQGLAHHII